MLYVFLGMNVLDASRREIYSVFHPGAFRRGETAEVGLGRSDISIAARPGYPLYVF